MRIFGLLILLACWSLSMAAFGAPFDALRDIANKQVSVTALAVDLSTGKQVDAVNANQRLVPASLSKLFTAAVALEHWGSDHHFSTQLYTDGKVNGDHIDGNLILAGGGDPGLVSETLWTLIGQLQSRGIQQVKGDIVVDASLFGPQNCQSADRCSAKKASAHAYNSGLSPAGINYGAWCVKVTAAKKAGKPAQVNTCPFALDIALNNQVTTSAKSGRITLRRSSDKENNQDQLKVSGRIGINQKPITRYVSAGDSNQFAGLQLKQQLQLAGIKVTGDIKVVFHRQQDWQLLATMQSQPLSTQVKKMLEYSNNYMADVLALNLLSEVDSGSLSLAAAGDQLLGEASDFVAPDKFTEGPVSPRLASGSGLSLESRLSASDLVTLLGKAYVNTDIFPAFVAGLTVPEYSVLGILRGPEQVWKTRVMVKSGSLNQPHTVYGIAGYLRPDNDRWLAFAILLNGTDKRPHIPYSDSMTLLRQSVVSLVKE